MNIKKPSLWVIDKPMFLDKARIRVNDLVINFTYQRIEHPGIVDLADSYNQTRNDIKKRYINYIAGLGKTIIRNKPLSAHFTIENCSLWWFNKITKKDTFNDPLLDDICKAILINKILKDKNIDKVVVLTESPLLNSLWGKKRLPVWPLAKMAIRRIRLLVKMLQIKIFLVTCKNTPVEKVKYLFFTYYPGNWTKDVLDNYSDRFYRKLPGKLGSSGYLMFLDHPTKSINKIDLPAYYVQSHLKVSEILWGFINIKNVFKYLIMQNWLLQHCRFEGVDLRSVYNLYFWESMLYKEYYYRLLIKGTKRICENVLPKSIVSVGEFGLNARAVVAGAKMAGVPVIWLQHAVVSNWKLWYFNDRSEIDINRKGPYIDVMPVSDWFIIWGQHTKVLLADYGYPVERMVTLGNPRYDVFHGLKGNDLENNTQRVVLTPTIDEEEMALFISLADEIKVVYPDMDVILKPHPRFRELVSFEKAIGKMTESRHSGARLEEGSIEKYYSRSTLFISGISTVGIEAAYFGARVLTYTLKYHNRFTPDWLQTGTYANSPKEVIDVIKKHQDIPLLNWKEYFLPPGQAQNNVINFILGK